MNESVWTVGALCKAVSETLTDHFDTIWVRGEVSNFTQAVSGHCYFSLKDAQGQLRCAMFKRSAAGLAKLPRNGDQVEIKGRLGVYESRGDLQLLVEVLRPLGQGAMYEEFLRLKAKLEQEGLFAPDGKRPVIPRPKVIGLVTSLSAAALHDVASALQRRVSHIPVVLAPAQVQGAMAADSLIKAIDQLEKWSKPDVILLVRGGGSMEDMWCFNHPDLVRRIRQCRVPVISGVGHETDFTLCDFAADLRAPTPTAAAELCAVSTEDSWQELQRCADQIISALRQHMGAKVQHLDRLQELVGRPQSIFTKQLAGLERLAMRLIQARTKFGSRLELQLTRNTQKGHQLGHKILQQQSHRVQLSAAKLSALDPRQVLQRGYSWLQDQNGRALMRTGQFMPEQQVQAVLADGEVDLRVLGTRTGNALE